MKRLKLKNLILTFLVCVIFIACANDIKITTKDIMNVFTIGWHKGYQEGLRQGVYFNKNAEWTESSFKIDSCFIELHLLRELK